MEERLLSIRKELSESVDHISSLPVRYDGIAHNANNALRHLSMAIGCVNNMLNLIPTGKET